MNWRALGKTILLLSIVFGAINLAAIVVLDRLIIVESIGPFGLFLIYIIYKDMNHFSTKEWGEMEVVEDLEDGWKLARQREQNGQNERFTIVAKESEYRNVFLHPGGAIKEEPHFAPSKGDALKEYQTGKKRLDKKSKSRI